MKNLYNRLSQAASAFQQSLENTKPEKPYKYAVMMGDTCVGMARTPKELLEIISKRTVGNAFDVYQVKNINDSIERALKKEIKSYDASSSNDSNGATFSGA
jgi:hypothetical protein